MKNLQKDFFHKITQNKDIKQDKSLALYRDLVFYRYEEVLKNAFPILEKNISSQMFISLVEAFLKKGAKSQYIWKMPKEFKEFLCQKKEHKKLPFLKDLLWFEWIEIELLMQDYTKTKISKLSFKKRYKLSKIARIKKLDYKIHLHEFDKKDECVLLVYYDKNIKHTIYREISFIFYDFLKAVLKSGFEKSLKQVCKKYNLNMKNSKKEFEKAFRELVLLGIFIKA